MAEMTIQLKTNPETGKKDIIVSLHSDDDALPHEHEQQHRQLVDKLIEGGMLNATELGKVVVQRDRDQSSPNAPQSNSEAEQRTEQSEGS